MIGDLQVQVYGTATIDASGSANISTFQVDGEGQASIESPCTIGIMNVDGTAEFTADCSIDHFADSAGRINVLAGANVTVLNQSEIFNYDLIPAELRVVGTGAKVLFKTTRTHIQMLTVDDGGVVELQQRNQAPTSSDARVLIVDELDLVGSGSTPSGRLDLMDNNLILNNQPSPSNALADITAYIKHALENGGNYDWLGNGIGSTWAYSQNQSAGSFLYALGVILNDLAQVGGSGPVYNSFAGVSVGQDDVLVKYTYFGDADLSGNVDATDYSLIDNGYTNQLGGWINGDFDYSGTIDATDYALIDNAFTNQGGPLFAGGGDDDVLTTAAQDLFGKFADEYDLLSPQQMIDLHRKHLGSEYDDALSAVQSGKLH
ncbi:hypothetical protein [Fontivita pretiosa]|uniref:hypothetical protein n=1 Tax=Fontivita pretiosa TaxID=2989684 RepID=UPI003D17D5C6